MIRPNLPLRTPLNTNSLRVAGKQPRSYKNMTDARAVLDAKIDYILRRATMLKS